MINWKEKRPNHCIFLPWSSKRVIIVKDSGILVESVLELNRPRDVDLLCRGKKFATCTFLIGRNCVIFHLGVDCGAGYSCPYPQILKKTLIKFNSTHTISKNLYVLFGLKRKIKNRLGSVLLLVLDKMQKTISIVHIFFDWILIFVLYIWTPGSMNLH